MQYTRFRVARGLNWVTCGAFEWLEISLADVDRQRADPQILSDWRCDRCTDRKRAALRDRL
jgi:hypothetical protein